MRPSTFQRIDIALSRDLVTDYDKIKQIADHIDAIELISTAMEAGVDFGDVANLATDVNALETAMDGKVDKVTGSSLMTDAEHTKLQFIAQQATKNQTDAYLVDRVNHTGTQSADTLTDGVVNVAMTVDERNRLVAMDDGANNYVHPATHQVTVLDGTGQLNKVVRTDGVGAVGWGDLTWSDIAGKPGAYVPAAHDHDMAEITTGQLSASRIATSTSRMFATEEQLAKLATAETTDNKGIPNGYAPLDSNGKINASYLNDLNLMEVFMPADQASMLMLASAHPGDIAYRMDTGNTYMLAALPAATLANWKQINIGANVVSVNGLTGIVSLSTDEMPEGTVNRYFTDSRADARVAAVAYTKTQTQTSLPKVGLDVAAGETVLQGQMAWNADERTVDLGLGSSVTLQVGQEQVIGVQNDSGATIGNMTVCMYAGSIGNSGKFRVVPFTGSDSKMLVGIATEDIANGAAGFVTTFGKIRGVDTRAWTTGTILYVGSTGAMTSTAPVGMRVPVAVVISSAINGTVFVRMAAVDENAYEPKNVNIQSHITSTSNPHGVTASQLGLGNYVRADRDLASRNIANMVYVDGDLTKIQYDTASDVNYEVLGYTSGNLTTINHYVASTLRGTTTLTYSNGTLISAVFVGA